MNVDLGTYNVPQEEKKAPDVIPQVAVNTYCSTIIIESVKSQAVKEACYPCGGSKFETDAALTARASIITLIF
jgi:hypothetical protein